MVFSDYETHLAYIDQQIENVNVHFQLPRSDGIPETGLQGEKL